MSAGPTFVSDLLEKGWIEHRGAASEISYRITEKGSAAKKTSMRIYL